MIKEEFEEFINKFQKMELIIDNDQFHIINLGVEGKGSDIAKLYSWIEQQIKSACDKQKALCYKEYVGEYDDNGAGKLILNAPYPEGVV